MCELKENERILSDSMVSPEIFAGKLYDACSEFTVIAAVGTFGPLMKCLKSRIDPDQPGNEWVECRME